MFEQQAGDVGVGRVGQGGFTVFVCAVWGGVFGAEEEFGGGDVVVEGGEVEGGAEVRVARGDVHVWVAEQDKGWVAVAFVAGSHVVRALEGELEGGLAG